MGIYDQLVQLDKGTTPDPLPPTRDTSLNPEPEQNKPAPATLTATRQKKSPKARLPDSQIARNQTSPNARLPESQQARLPESQQARLTVSQLEKWLAAIQPYLDLRAANKVSLRYPDTLIAWLEESLYRLKKATGKKLTKNAVLVAALAYVLWDLEQNGQASFLYQQFSQEVEEEAS